jgi:hypothetical protein
MDDDTTEKYSENVLPNDTDSEMFKSGIDYSAIEKAVKVNASLN